MEVYSLQYVKSGVGTPVIFLHGFSFDKRIFHPVIKKLEAKHTVYNINLPGVMESSLISDYSMKNQADIIADFIVKNDLNKPVLIGHSMGGYIGLELLENHGDLISGLCLFHSHPFPDTDAKIEDRKKTLEFIGKYGTALYMKQTVPNLFAQLYAQTNVFQIDSLIQVASRIPQQVVEGHIEAMITRKDRCETLKNAQIPIMVVAGRQDIAVTEEQWKATALMPKLSKLTAIDNCVHMGMLEHVSLSANELAEFINTCNSLKQS